MDKRTKKDKMQQSNAPALDALAGADFVDSAVMDNTDGSYILDTHHLEGAIQMDKRLKQDKGYKLGKLAAKIVDYFLDKQWLNSGSSLSRDQYYELFAGIKEQDEDHIYEMLLTAKFGPEDKDG